MLSPDSRTLPVHRLNAQVERVVREGSATK